jgi:hypothetical protein
MVIGSTDQAGKRHYFYRCPPIGDCPQRVTISANVAEQTVINAVRELIAGITGTAGMSDGVSDAERDLEKREYDLAAAVKAFDGLEDVEAARDRLLELRGLRDQARVRVDELRSAVAPAVTLSGGDWHDLSLDAQRALIRAVVERAVVAPGRSPDRITIEPRGQ